MNKLDYSGVKALLAVENPMIRQGLQNALQQEGFPRLTEALALDRMITSLIETPFDLIITATELANDFIPPFIGQLRQGGFKHHPVPVVIELLTASETDYIKRVIDSGPDDILQLPISPKQLLARIAILSTTRKMFIVTSNYVGPDRRQNIRPEASTIPLIDVANPLALRAKRATDQAIRSDIAASSDKLRQMRLERITFELQWLLRALRQLYQGGPPDQTKLESFCERINSLALHAPRLLTDPESATVTQLADKLVTGTTILQKNGFSADATVLQGLGSVITTLTRTVRGTLPPEILSAASQAAAIGVK